jgi:hypothetical protein
MGNMYKKTKIDWGRFWFFLFWVAFNPTWQIMQGDFQALQKDGQVFPKGALSH